MLIKSNLIYLSHILFINLISVKSQLFKTGICGIWLSENDVDTYTRINNVLLSYGGHFPGNAGSPRNHTHHNEFNSITTITVCAWPNATFHTDVLQPYHNLKVLEIEHSNFTEINQFKGFHNLAVINISWTNLERIQNTLFQNLKNLKHLDLRWNKIRHIDGHINKFLSHKLEQLYLADNPWNCSSNLKWIKNHTKYSIADAEQLICDGDKYKGRPVLMVMSYKVILKELCKHEELRDCSCHISYLRPNEQIKGFTTFTPMYTINCSYLGLTKLPTFLPPNTTHLYATHNQISSVDTIRDNKYYENVHDIYLDYNELESIDVLENSAWLDTFRIFSLRGNKIQRILVYAMHDALEHNHHAGKLYLSENPWECDCIFTAKLQELLMKYVNIIIDSKNITCVYENGDVAEVLTLKRTDLCNLTDEESIMQPLDILNIILLTLIITILSKLGYDYYNYRKNGSLPWIVTKLP